MVQVIGQLGGVSGAARALATSQPAVTQAVSNLEASTQQRFANILYHLVNRAEPHHLNALYTPHKRHAPHGLHTRRQRNNRVTGSPTGNLISISSVGTKEIDATVDVVYNPTENEYLVVWWGDDASINSQVHVQLLSAQGGELGTND